MSVTLPGELVWALNMLGFTWPEADEDQLRACAQHWRDFSAEVGNVLADSNRAAAQVVSENRGDSIDAFERYWQGIGGGGGHLVEAQEAASLAADCLEAFALVVEGLKAAVIAQLVVFAAEFAAAQLAASLTFGLAEGAAAAEVVATRSVVRALLDDGVKRVTSQVLQQVRSRAREIFAQMLKRALVTGAVSTGLDVGRQEYEIEVLHTRRGLSVGELAAAGGAGTVLGAGSTLFHLRLEAGSPNGMLTDPRALLESAAGLRTDTGALDEERLAELVDRLPTIDVGDDAEAALRRFAAEAAGVDPDGVRLSGVAGEGAKGVSGAPVYLLKDPLGRPVAVVKRFTGTPELGRELSATERLRSGEFTKFRAPDVLGAGKIPAAGGAHGVVVTTVAPGGSVDDILQAVQGADPGSRAGSLNDLRDAVRATGHAFADLHTTPAGSGGPVARAYVEENLGQLNRVLDHLEASRPTWERLGLDVDAVTSHVRSAMEDFAASPGGASLNHGDANIGNIFHDQGSGTTFIDIQTAHGAMGADGQPIGSAGRDLAKFEQSIRDWSSYYRLRPEETAELQTIFHESYVDAGGPRLDDSAMTVFRARQALTQLLAIGGVFPPRPPATELNAESYVELVKEMLGL